MKKSTVKRVFALLFVLLALLCLLFASGCSASEHYAIDITREFIDSIIADDYDTAFSFFADTDKASFDDFYSRMRSQLEGVRSYTLDYTSSSRKIENGVSYYYFTFELIADGTAFSIETYFDQKDKLHTVNFLPKTALSSREIKPYKMVTSAFSLAAIGFCVWMVVDCAKRNVRKKALWILLILAGFAFTVTFGYKFDIGFSFVLALPISSVSSDSLCTSLRVALPLGAIIYCMLRKRITIPQAFREVEFTDITQ